MMGEGTASGDGSPRGGLPRPARVLLRIALVLAVGGGVGLLLTAPIVGWPGVFPAGLLMNAPEGIRDVVGLLVMFGTPLITVVKLRRWIAR
jgi:hypothetical protein